MKNSRGVVLSIVVIMMLMMTMIAGYALVIAYHQNKILSASSGGRIMSYYRSQAGMVDALWRVQNNYTINMTPAGNFTDPNYDPDPYGLDIDQDPPAIIALGVNAIVNPNVVWDANIDPRIDVVVNISTQDQVANSPTRGLRAIQSTGNDALVNAP